MILALLLSLAAATPTQVGRMATSSDPPVQIWLNHDNRFQRGDEARVHVKVAEDGYLVVLRVDAFGRVRVLFPLDPGDDAFVSGGRTIDVRGRGGREAFSVDERAGSGLVLAARSGTPFKVGEFVRGDHWDYRVLTARQASDDKEQALLEIVQRMEPDGHLDYGTASYTVASPQRHDDGWYHAYAAAVGLQPGYGYLGLRGFAAFNLAFGDPLFFRPLFFRPLLFRPFFFQPFFFRASCFDRLFFDPVFCDPFLFNPFFFHRRFLLPRVTVFSRTVIVLRGRTGVVDGFPVRPGLRSAFGRPRFAATSFSIAPPRSPRRARTGSFRPGPRSGVGLRRMWRGAG